MSFEIVQCAFAANPRIEWSVKSTNGRHCVEAGLGPGKAKH